MRRINNSRYFPCGAEEGARLGSFDERPTIESKRTNKKKNNTVKLGNGRLKSVETVGGDCGDSKANVSYRPVNNGAPPPFCMGFLLKSDNEPTFRVSGHTESPEPVVFFTEFNQPELGFTEF